MEVAVSLFDTLSTYLDDKLVASVFGSDATEEVSEIWNYVFDEMGREFFR